MNFIEPLNATSQLPVYRQVMNSVVDAIRNKQLKKGDRLPSINEFSREMSIAQGTVLKAYAELKKDGIIDSQQGKGFFVASENTQRSLNIFLLVDTLNQYKEVLYNSFIEALDPQTTIDIYFHHYNIKRFEKLIVENLGYYNYYVIMPHFNEDVSGILRQIPSDRLILIDNEVHNLRGNYAAVYQNFKDDIYQSLKTGFPVLKKYDFLNLVLPKNHRFEFVPDDLISGFKKFCSDYKIKFKVYDFLDVKKIVIGNAYLFTDDFDLVTALKYVNLQNWELGKDVGLICYDDTLVKEILAGGITVISTDFKQMGITAADFIKGNKRGKIENPCTFIIRKSL
ncbi:MAG: hypothetical protein A2W90_08960 [Bacteroidetes bacterium GWF2_42_66]|nr:MAG: hypothetical protein A2W92_17205 [Bacteroidetes bacterium GWA2_42_15]OFX97119.1 MAG: hypothetical protein A2W89_00085 [Bacteroidetes bacterium GWE2_42_39]OFY46190.1 MAG: hypothetical protein A2W90_08960 [Bacteroidetes bacterium GWF2_42_66]HBL78044.1 GntR family transcriptional regulator [Prolixibacteraceae bacterium]HCR92056.1 GntR family transcriptional regulator [Prolixibacteraceae bacterium]